MKRDPARPEQSVTIAASRLRPIHKLPHRADADIPATRIRCVPYRDTDARRYEENLRYPVALRNRGNADRWSRPRRFGKDGFLPSPARARNLRAALLRSKDSRIRFQSQRSGPLQTINALN